MPARRARRRALIRIAEDLARAHRLMVRALDRLATDKEEAPAATPAVVPANVPPVPAVASAPADAPARLSPLERAILAAATEDETSRKVLIRRAGRQPTSTSYAAVRGLLERGLLAIGATGGIRRGLA